jgi:hypothetical protein
MRHSAVQLALGGAAAGSGEALKSCLKRAAASTASTPPPPLPPQPLLLLPKSRLMSRTRKAW